jgi:hypothetical protein
MLILICVVYLFGISSAGLGRLYTTPHWQHHKEIQVKLIKVHKVLAWVAVILGYFTTSTGLIRYAEKQSSTDYKLAIANVVFFTSFTLLFEVGFRQWRRRQSRELNCNPDLSEMTVD